MPSRLHPTRSSSGLALFLITTVIVSTACSAAPQKARSPDLRRASVHNLVLPFDTYEFTTLDIHTIESAEDVLIRACMREKGMDWISLPPPSPENADPPNLRRYGLVDRGAAARYGYHLPPLTDAQARRESVWAARENLPPREKLAAFGRNGATGGCWGQAHAQLLRDVPPVRSSLLARYSARAFNSARRAPEVKEAFGRWSSCLRRGGFGTYADPLQVGADPAWSRTSRPTARERDVALADVRCKEETDLVATWSAADRRVQQDTIRAHAEDFRAFAASKNSWLDAARRTLRQEG